MTGNDGWAKVPSALILSDLPAGALRLYAYLAWRQGENESAWPSYTRIADDLGICRRSVASYAAQLEARGWLSRDGTRGAVNHYQVILSCTSANIAPPTRAKRDTHEQDPLNKKQPTRAGAKKRGVGDPRVAPLIREIAEVCQIDLAIPQNWKWLGKEAKDLLTGHYDIEQIRQFQAWWLSDEWRATHTPIPTVKKLRELIGQATHGAQAPASSTGVIDLGCNYE